MNKKRKFITAVVLVAVIVAVINGIFYLSEKNRYAVSSIEFPEETVLSAEEIEIFAEPGDTRLAPKYFSVDACPYKIVFTDGTVISEVPPEPAEPLSFHTTGYDIDIEGGHIDTGAYILYDEFLSAMEKGEKEITVYFSVDYYSKTLNKHFNLAEDYEVKVGLTDKK